MTAAYRQPLAEGVVEKIRRAPAKLDGSKSLAKFAHFGFHPCGRMGDDSMRGQPGFFDVDERFKHLSDLGDQLEAFRVAVDFETFQPDLKRGAFYSDGSLGGRPPFDPVMMVKILVIQAANNLSDERTELAYASKLFWSFRCHKEKLEEIPSAGCTEHPRFERRC